MTDTSDLILAVAVVPPTATATAVARAAAIPAIAAARAGALAVLDAAVADQVRPVVQAFTARCDRPFALRPGAELAAAGLADPSDLPPANTMIVLGAEVVADLDDEGIAGGGHRRWSPHGQVVVEITSPAQARLARSAGATGLIAKGCESGGAGRRRSSPSCCSSGSVELGVPVWAQGGIGVHTAAACIAGGAAGVVLDSQLALVRESSLPRDVRAASRPWTAARRVVDRRAPRRTPVPTWPWPQVRRASGRPRVAAGLGPDITDRPAPARPGRRVRSRPRRPVRDRGGVVAAARAAIAHRTSRSPPSIARSRRAAPFARAHGPRYPIAQGPMTRVSATARAFAAAVADAGGLPFLALALMPGRRGPRRCSSETARPARRPAVGRRASSASCPPELREAAARR